MKKLIRILLLAGLVIPFITACDDENVDLFPEEYRRVLAIKDAGTVDLVLSSAKTSIQQNVLVLKGGGDPESDVSLQLAPLSKEEAMDEWKYKETEVSVIPSEAFSIAAGESITIGSNESYYKIPVTIYPAILNSYRPDHEGAKWILPLILVSDDATVDKNFCRVLYTIDVKTPAVDWASFEDETTSIQIDYKTKDLPIKMELAYAESNDIEFTANLDKTASEKLVAAYNAANKTSYELLPESAYSMDDISFVAGTIDAEGVLKLSRTGLTADKSYLLPLKISLSSKKIDKSKLIKYLVITNPKYSFETIDTTKWKVALCNSEAGGIGSWGSPCLFDGNLGVPNWSQRWSGDNMAAADNDDYWYDRASEYHSFLGKRDVSNVVLVVDMQQVECIASLGFNKSTANWADRTFKSCKVCFAPTFTFKSVKDGGTIADYNAVANGEVGWTGSWDVNAEDRAYELWVNIANGGDADNAALATGRYLKLHTFDTYHTGSRFVATFNELLAKRLLAIDGEPVIK